MNFFDPPTTLDLQDGFQIGDLKFRSTPAAFNIHRYSRAFSGSGDRFAFYSIETSDKGFAAYTSNWKPNSAVDIQFLRNYYTDEASVSKTWWRIRPANTESQHNKIPTTWAPFDGGRNKAVDGFCIFSSQQDEIYRKLTNAERPTFSPGQTGENYTSIHAYYPIIQTGVSPLVGFKNQYDLTAVITPKHTTQFSIISNTSLPDKFRIFIPPGVSFVKLETRSKPDSCLEIKSKLGSAPANSKASKQSTIDADVFVEILDRIPTGVFTPEELSLVNSNHDNAAEVFSINPTEDLQRTITWFAPGEFTTIENWLYCVITSPAELLSARLYYIIEDVVAFKDWYATANWNSVGDPILLQETLTYITETGMEVRGDHEVLTLQGWDGKTYINLKQGTDPLAIRLTGVAKSSGLYATQFYDHASRDSKNSGAYKAIFGDKPKNFEPTFHTLSEKTDFWDPTKISYNLHNLPVLKSYNSTTDTIRYFAMIAYILTNTKSDIPTIYGGLEESIEELDKSGAWITPPITAKVKPYLSSSKSEIAPIIMHLFEEITEVEFNTHQYISESLPY